MQPILLSAVSPRPVAAQSAPTFAGKKSQRDETVLRPLIIEGKGTARRDPDIMRITLSLKEEGDDKKKVNQTLTEKAQALFAAIKALAIPFQTQPSLHVNEKSHYDRQSGQQVIDGFVGQYQLTLQEESKKPDAFPDHAGTVRQVAAEHDANFHGPAFSLSPERYNQGQQEANNKAYLNARKKAQSMARAGDFTINNEPLEIRVGEVENYQPVRGGARAFAAGASLESFSDNSAGGQPPAEIFEFKPIEVPSQRVRTVFQILEKPAADDDAGKKAKKADKSR